MSTPPPPPATNLFVGLYSENNGHRGARLTGGNSTAFQKSACNTIPVPAVSVAAAPSTGLYYSGLAEL
jgi:hypothetical protein